MLQIGQVQRDICCWEIMPLAVRLSILTAVLPSLLYELQLLGHHDMLYC
jgi:hypothetical protein